MSFSNLRQYEKTNMNEMIIKASTAEAFESHKFYTKENMQILHNSMQTVSMECQIIIVYKAAHCWKSPQLSKCVKH